MAAESGSDVHHGGPRWLLRLFDAAAGGLADRLEFNREVERWGIEVRGLAREDLTLLIESSTREIRTTKHRRQHQEASDFVRWGSPRGPKNPGPLRPAVLLAARKLPMGARQLEALKFLQGSPAAFVTRLRPGG